MTTGHYHEDSDILDMGDDQCWTNNALIFFLIKISELFVGTLMQKVSSLVLYSKKKICT